MIYEVAKKNYKDAPYNINEIVRYTGAKKLDASLESVIASCWKELEKIDITFSVCYVELPLKINEDIIDFGDIKMASSNLAHVLDGTNKALIFACTIGMGIDRLIQRYSQIDELKALVLQAIGAERVETFIDIFIKEYEDKNNVKLTKRFSPGYGDLSLETQKDVFALLKPEKSIGVTLNDSLLMSPSKSVTAIAGINGDCGKDEDCLSCDRTDCEYRR